MNPNAVYLVQTDTALGFLTLDTTRLDAIKNRPAQKKYLVNTSSLAKLKTLTRIPSEHKKRIRRTTKTTFVYKPNLAIRVSFDAMFNRFLEKFDTLYSTSANESGKTIELEWAKEQADVVVFAKPLERQSPPSRILKLGKNRLKRLR